MSGVSQRLVFLASIRYIMGEGKYSREIHEKTPFRRKGVSRLLGKLPAWAISCKESKLFRKLHVKSFFILDTLLSKKYKEIMTWTKKTLAVASKELELSDEDGELILDEDNEQIIISSKVAWTKR